MGKTPLLFFFRVCACCSIAFGSGISFAWTSPVIPKLNSATEDNPLSQPITSTEESWLAALLTAGSAIAPMITCFAVDKIGRKMTLQISAIPATAAYIFAAFAVTIESLYAARFAIGLGVGGVFSVLPLYLAEISEPKNRGAVGCGTVMFSCAGTLFSFAVGPFLSVWVFSLVCAIPFGVFLLASLTIIPESPHFLVAVKGKREGEKTLVKLRQKSRGEVQKELLVIVEDLENAVANKASVGDLFKTRGNRKALVVALGLMLFQQLSGINVMLCYLQPIFAAAGGLLSPEIPPIIVGAVQFLTTILTSLLADKLGRRPLLLSSCIGCCITLANLAAYFLLQRNGCDVSAISWLPLVSVVSYICFHNLGLAPLAWAMMGELFSANVKAMGSTIATSLCMWMAVMTTVAFPLLNDSIGIGNSFLIFSVCSAVGVVFVWFAVPETKGKSLGEVQQMLNGRKLTINDIRK